MSPFAKMHSSSKIMRQIIGGNAPVSGADGVRAGLPLILRGSFPELLSNVVDRAAMIRRPLGSVFCG